MKGIKRDARCDRVDHMCNDGGTAPNISVVVGMYYVVRSESSFAEMESVIAFNWKVCHDVLSLSEIDISVRGLNNNRKCQCLD